MSTNTHSPNVPQLSDDGITDPGLREVIDRAAKTKSPPPSWYRTMGHNSEVAQEFARYWDMLHRGGTVAHRITRGDHRAGGVLHAHHGRQQDGEELEHRAAW